MVNPLSHKLIVLAAASHQYGCVSSSAGCSGIEQGICFPQNELKVVPHVTTTAACCDACLADPRCTAFTMNHDGKPNGDGLTPLTEHQKYSPRCGLKYCNTDPKCSGNCVPCNRYRANCTSGQGHPPPPPGPPELNNHKVTLDENGLIESWLPRDTAFDRLLHKAYGWLIDSCPVQPNGLPTYMYAARTCKCLSVCSVPGLTAWKHRAPSCYAGRFQCFHQATTHQTLLLCLQFGPSSRRCTTRGLETALSLIM